MFSDRKTVVSRSYEVSDKRLRSEILKCVMCDVAKFHRDVGDISVWRAKSSMFPHPYPPPQDFAEVKIRVGDGPWHWFM
jgi:hypothetical protein